MSEEKINNPKNAADIYLRMAEMHLQRVNTLQATEWKVAVTFWAGMALSVSTALANRDMAISLLVGNEVGLALFQMVTGGIYLFVFCPLNYRSLVTERNSYQYFQNLASNCLTGGEAHQIGSRDSGRPSLEQVGISACFTSGIWWFKGASVVMLMSGVWYLLTHLRW